MELDEFRSLIESGEGKKVEFKTSQIIRNPSGKNRYKIAKEMVALANRKGGNIIFGIDDDTESVEEHNIIEDKALDTVSSIASDNCSPPIEFNCNHFDEGLRGNCQAFVVEIEPKDQIPYAIVEKSGSNIRKREYRIRAGEDSRLVTDSELFSLFSGQTGQRFENGSITHLPLNLSTKIPQLVEPYPSALSNFRDFLSEISDEEWEWIIDADEPSNLRVNQLVTELFPFVVLYSLPADYWVYYVEDEYGLEDLDEMFDCFEERPITDFEFEESVCNDPDLLISELDLDPMEFFEQGGIEGAFMIPHDVEVTVTRIDNVYIALNFESDVLDGGLSLGGAPSNPTDGIHQGHPLADLVDDDNVISITLSTWLEFEFGYPDVEDNYIREHKIFAESLHEMLDEQWDWKRCLREESTINYRIEHILEGIDEKVDRLLQD